MSMGVYWPLGLGSIVHMVDDRVREATLDDVARRVGVSPRTVSRVVNNEVGISEATRQRVLAAVEELHYRPNMMARALMTKRSRTVGLVGGEMTDPFFPAVAEAVEHRAWESGRTMFFASHRNDPKRQAKMLESLWSYAVDGVIVFPAPGSIKQLRDYARRGLRIVVVDDLIRSPNIACVRFDLEAGVNLGVQHLLDGGRRKIGMIASAASSRRRRRRERNFQTAFDDAGIEPGTVVRAPTTVTGGEAGANELLDLESDLDAIFAYNDLMAIGAIRAVQALGRRVPEDIAVIGFDDIEMSTFVTPALTTIRLNRSLLGNEVTQALHNLIDAPGGNPEPAVLPVDLVVREST